MKKSEKNIHLACYISKTTINYIKKVFWRKPAWQGKKQAALAKGGDASQIPLYGMGRSVDTLKRN